MVFKAKQRAETNYYDKIVGEQDTTVAGTNKKDFQTRHLAKQAANMLRPENVDVNMSYNWPYDFFSLVELVKIDAEVTLSDSDALLKRSDHIFVKRGVRGQKGKVDVTEAIRQNKRKGKREPRKYKRRKR